MSVREGDSGKELVIAASFDMSASTDLTMHFKGPNGESFTRSTPDVTAPAVPLITEIGTLEASTYFQYTCIATDFPDGTEGDWTMCGVYTDDTLTPDDIFSGDKGEFEVGEGCFG